MNSYEQGDVNRARHIILTVKKRNSSLEEEVFGFQNYVDSQKAKEEKLIKKLSELANAQSDYAATQECIAVKDQEFEAKSEEVKRLRELAKCARSAFEESEKRCAAVPTA